MWVARGLARVVNGLADGHSETSLPPASRTGMGSNVRKGGPVLNGRPAAEPVEPRRPSKRISYSTETIEEEGAAMDTRMGSALHHSIPHRRTPGLGGYGLSAAIPKEKKCERRPSGCTAS